MIIRSTVLAAALGATALLAAPAMAAPAPIAPTTSHGGVHHGPNGGNSGSGNPRFDHGNTHDPRGDSHRDNRLPRHSH